MKTRCPKCKGKPVDFIEHWRGTAISFGATPDGYADMDDSTCHSTGDPYKVTADCAQGHRWKVRGVVQITELEPKGEREGE